jgi:cobalamin biosynthesis protein CbiG
MKNIAHISEKTANLWVGIGCQKGVSFSLIETGIKQIFAKFNLNLTAIKGIATLDSKAKEEGIKQLCTKYDYPLLTFTATTLKQIPVPNPAIIVQQITHTPSVAEAACLAAVYYKNPTLTHSLLVSKQIIKIPPEKGTVTLAVAESSY